MLTFSILPTSVKGKVPGNVAAHVSLTSLREPNWKTVLVRTSPGRICIGTEKDLLPVSICIIHIPIDIETTLVSVEVLDRTAACDKSRRNGDCYKQQHDQDSLTGGMIFHTIEAAET